MPTRIEALTVRGGEADVELCVADGDLVLLVEGQPGVLVWPGDELSRDAWILRARDTQAVLERIGHLPVCEEGLDAGRSLVDQLEPLLAVLSDGRYTAQVVRPTEVSRDASVARERPAHVGSLMEWIGLHRVRSADELLIGCVPRESVGALAVEAARRRIRAGFHPAVVALTTPGSTTSFVLAGHAALEAYALEERSPRVLELSYHAPRSLSADQVLTMTEEAAKRCAQLVAAHVSALRAARPVAT